MRAKVTRTLQAPQYAPINMELEEECTPEQFEATLNKLADIIENTLRQRYPQYAGVLPIVQKKEVAARKDVQLTPFESDVLDQTQLRLAKKEPTRSRPNEKVITIQKGAALVECINHCTSFDQLRGYFKDLDSDEADEAYNKKAAEFKKGLPICK